MAMSIWLTCYNLFNYMYHCWYYRWFHLPLIIFCALKYVFSCSLFIVGLEVPPSSTLFFLLKALLGKYAAPFFLFFNVIYISSLVFLTLANDFLWIVLLMHKHILKDFCQYQGRLTSIFLIALIFLNILIPPIQLIT